ncbi:class I SAM-dependent methyltransferase [Phycicoccus endophyticus]|uniref:Class I SAM-dependent methyltransferase n=1 Tax=Phycicoccus endophyticus TaxID=1690220 RepID=A0A7G9QZT4_9MICO|nr:class I SAM-dependent methyltransferase [Phycicoccus endophyticus]NHI20057.1 class I SAM-dependent methyltransferase [Phycicoccus endophyticus]QNN48859.1 class I SAM-dependent methyltransferase [Phycicoccus endophyticus]GGL42240.1 methyltransferase [Phycicoccus endophyticus]
MTPSPPRAEEALLARLRADLTSCGFTVSGVTALLGPMAAGALERDQALPAQRVTVASQEPVAALVRLFTLGDPVDATEVAAALPTLGVAGASALGLVAPEGDAVVALCDLRPYAAGDEDWWVASDLGELATGEPLRPDHVLGIGGASTTLASWTPRPQVARALDLGTGCGVQALHLGAHAETVVVTDLSERALGYARFNAALNGLSWQVRSGSMLDPVAGDRFDLVVSNPPFVITPRSGAVPLFEYRDAGASGDDVVRDLVRSVGAHLEPGGVAQILGNWEVPPGGTWTDRVQEWLEPTGLDAWVVQREVQDPAEYAETWARDGGHHPGTADFNAMYGAWLDDFAARDVEVIGFGVLTLQRPRTDRPPFRDLLDVPGPVEQPMGPAVLRGLEARTWLAEHDDDALLDVAWRRAEDVTEERHSVPGEDDPRVILLRQGGGLRRHVVLSTLTAGLVSVCDGELTARAATAAIAGLLGLEEDAAREEATGFLRRVVADGMLVREDR